MPANRPRVIVTRKLPDAIETRMRELFDTDLNLEDKPMDQARLIEAVQRADVLVPTVTDRIDSKVLVRAGPNLKLVANFGNGVDNIDVKTALERGITVTNTPGVLTEDTADMTMALMLAVPRRLVEGAEELKAEHFQGWAPSWMLGHRIWGKRLGIIGMGRIGQAVARSACRSTIITANPSIRRSSANSPRPTGKASTRCSRAWTSFRSIARTRRRLITSCRRDVSS
jgi:glyoxylate reductase